MPEHFRRAFHANDIKVLEKTVLPALVYDHTGATANAWPPAQPHFGVVYSEMISNMIRNAPPPPTEAERIEASRRYVERGMADEREHQRLNAEAEARALAFNAEQRRLAAGG